jgi:hypothetical protein
MKIYCVRRMQVSTVFNAVLTTRLGVIIEACYALFILRESRL